MRNIDDLLNKYFEGETTCEEERELRRYFTGGNIAEHLQIYRPMFAFLEDEHISYLKKEGKKKPVRHTFMYRLGGIAAGLLLLAGIAGIYKHSSTPESYVIIDGKQYTDTKLVREEALSAFQGVSLSKDEVFATLFEE